MTKKNETSETKTQCAIQNVKPRIICYCGSLRFKKQFEEMEMKSLLRGEIALLPACMYVDLERKYGNFHEYKQMADEVHKHKIDLADEVFVIDPGGYIGSSTSEEIDYARSKGKKVKFYSTMWDG